MPAEAMEMSADTMDRGLRVEGLIRDFGGLRALDNVSLDVGPGAAMGVIGPNGSGKTTLINIISGVYRPSSGRVLLAGRSVGGLAPHRLAALGISRTFQVPHPFRELTVEENVTVAWRHAGRRRGSVDEALEFAELAHLRSRKAATLNVAQQKLLDLCRAVVTQPELIMVDELGAGLSHGELGLVAGKLRELTNRGIGLLVVEHLMGFLHQVTERALVMNAGRVIYSGTLTEALADPEVARVFLGA
jgi:branched-chain amino acid transport system ATP-binding protein